MFGLAQRLRDVQGMRVEFAAPDSRHRAGLMDQLAQAAPDDLHLQRSRSAMLDRIRRNLFGGRRSRRRRAAAEEGLAITRRLVAADPGNAGWHRDIERMSREGRRRAARGWRSDGRARGLSRRAWPSARALTVSDPDNVDWQRNVSVRLGKVGDVQLANGDRAGALAAYEESLAIMRKLVAADPGDAGWQRDLSVSLDRVGDVRLADGDRAGALAAYEESLDIRRKRAAADPGNAAWQRGMSVVLDKIGDAASGWRGPCGGARRLRRKPGDHAQTRCRRSRQCRLAA